MEAQFDLPSWSLASPPIGVCLFGFLSEPHGAVWILFAHCLSVREILCSVNDGYEGAYFGAIEGHVGEDAGSVPGGHGAFHGHSAGCNSRIRCCCDVHSLVGTQ